MNSFEISGTIQGAIGREIKTGKMMVVKIAVTQPDRDFTTNLEVIVWPDLIAKFAMNFRAGEFIHVKGYLRLNTFTTKDNIPVSKIQLVAQDFVLNNDF